MIQKAKNRSYLYFGGIFLAAAIFVLPIFFYGVPRSNDLPQHFQFAASVENSLRNSEIFPRWAENENNGYGGIGLRFYPPASYYVLAFGKILTNDWFAASCFAFFFWTLLSGIGAFLLAREFAGEFSAFASAVLYIFAPYHATELYGSFMYAEFAAAAVLPFCFLFLARIVRKDDFSAVFGFAFSFAALVYTHLPLAVIGALSFAIYILFSLNKDDFFRISKKVSLGALLGLAASSFQWIKILTEMKWLKHATDRFSATDFYDYRENFLLSFKYLGGLENDVHQLWFLDLVLLATLILAVPFAVLFYKKSADKRLLNGFFALTIFTIFIISPLSSFVWNNFGVLQKVQFPWRWLSILTLCAVVFAAGGFQFALEFAKTNKRPLFLILCGCLFVSIAFTVSQVIKQALFIPPVEFSQMTENIGARKNNEEWLTNWADKKTSENAEIVSRKFNAAVRSATERIYEFSGDGETAVRLPLFYYPHWRAEINGKPEEIKISGDGAVLLEIPRGEAYVKLEFVEPLIVKLSVFVSLFAFVFIVFLYFRTKFNG